MYSYAHQLIWTKQGIFTRFIHGFHNKHSCESQLLLTTHNLLAKANLWEQVDTAVLGFSKSLDAVPHIHLRRKLELLTAYTGSFLLWYDPSWPWGLRVWWLRAAILGHTWFTQVCPRALSRGHFCSYVISMTCLVFGDPQTTVQLFADGCLVYRYTQDKADRVHLQRDLSALVTWGETCTQRNEIQCEKM